MSERYDVWRVHYCGYAEIEASGATQDKYRLPERVAQELSFGEAQRRVDALEANDFREGVRYCMKPATMRQS